MPRFLQHLPMWSDSSAFLGRIDRATQITRFFHVRGERLTPCEAADVTRRRSRGSCSVDLTTLAKCACHSSVVSMPSVAPINER